MPEKITDVTRLNNVTTMPWLDFGVYQPDDGSQVEQAVTTAPDQGKRPVPDPDTFDL